MNCCRHASCIGKLLWEYPLLVYRMTCFHCTHTWLQVGYYVEPITINRLPKSR